MGRSKQRSWISCQVSAASFQSPHSTRSGKGPLNQSSATGGPVPCNRPLDFARFPGQVDGLEEDCTILSLGVAPRGVRRSGQKSGLPCRPGQTDSKRLQAKEGAS